MILELQAMKINQNFKASKVGNQDFEITGLQLLWNHYISLGLNFRGFRGYHQPRIYIPNE